MSGPRVGVLEREIMRATFAADTILPVESVMAMTGASLSGVYQTSEEAGRKVESFRSETGLTLSVVWWSEVMSEKGQEGGND